MAKSFIGYLSSIVSWMERKSENIVLKVSWDIDNWSPRNKLWITKWSFVDWASNVYYIRDFLCLSCHAEKGYGCTRLTCYVLTGKHSPFLKPVLC